MFCQQAVYVWVADGFRDPPFAPLDRHFACILIDCSIKIGGLTPLRRSNRRVVNRSLKITKVFSRPVMGLSVKV
uniref:Uncharacterized protein n=1 Tax=Solanum tuberosum TaxID=4113 RepID=M1DEX6_SOLTU